MKNIMLILRGCPGSGKDTWIKKMHLENYTLSSDDIRMLYSPLDYDIHGMPHISQEYDRDVWQTLYSILEQKMRQGQFIIINATNINMKTVNKYLSMCEKFLYIPVILDFEVSLETLLLRNKQREIWKQMPEEVIKDFYERKQNTLKELIDKQIKIIPLETNEINNRVEEIYNDYFYLGDLSNYKAVKVIGDIHGCFTALKQGIPEIKENEYYIFLGDYLDRGPENADTLKFLLSIYNKPNVAFLYGNHEAHLLSYVENEVSRSQDFNTETKYEIADIDKKQIRKFLKIMKTHLYFTRKVRGEQKLFFCSHAGCPDTDDYFATANYFIKGAGKYEDIEEIYKTYSARQKYKTTPAIQLHGHRNINKLPIKVDKYNYNLEGQVEYGGCLRIVTIDNKGIHCDNIKNNKTREIEGYKIDSVSNFVESCRKTPKFIQEKVVGENLSSFNFTRQAFFDSVWNGLTTKARGIFINTKTNEVVARGFDKFFNIGEKEETQIYNLEKNLTFPVKAYLKYNGFLGILGYNKEKDELLFCSKTSLSSEFANYFKTIFLNRFSTNIADIKNYLKKHNCSIVCEVVDPVNDPHIIKYDKAFVKILSIIKNELTYKEIELKEFMEELPFITQEDVKELCYEIYSSEEFKKFCQMIEQPTYKYKNEYIEGFVLEDNNGYKTKFKTPYYIYWKEIRSAIGKIKKGTKIKDIEIKTKGIEDTQKVLTFLSDNIDNLQFDEKHCDAVSIRDLYYKEK